MSVKDKMLNYEVAAPAQVWQGIAHTLDNLDKNKIHQFKKNNRVFYYSLAAAAACILFFSSIIWMASPKKNNDNFYVENANRINIPKEDNNDTEKKYITIVGPEGVPVKISSKVALLIASSNGSAANTEWKDKVKKWKDIMKVNILTPTTTNFLDIVELTQTVTASNP